MIAPPRRAMAVASLASAAMFFAYTALTLIQLWASPFAYRWLENMLFFGVIVGAVAGGGWWLAMCLALGLRPSLRRIKF